MALPGHVPASMHQRSVVHDSSLNLQILNSSRRTRKGRPWYWMMQQTKRQIKRTRPSSGCGPWHQESEAAVA